MPWSHNHWRIYSSCTWSEIVLIMRRSLFVTTSIWCQGSVVEEFEVTLCTTVHFLRNLHYVSSCPSWFHYAEEFQLFRYSTVTVISGSYIARVVEDSIHVHASFLFSSLRVWCTCKDFLWTVRIANPPNLLAAVSFTVYMYIHSCVHLQWAQGVLVTST